MERIKLFTAALLLAAMSAGNDMWALSTSGKKMHPVDYEILQWKRQPTVGFHFCGRPDIDGIQRKALCI